MSIRAALTIALLGLACRTDADPTQAYLLDPFAQATAALDGCPPVTAPVLDEQQMRAQAHSRAERGTSCCLAGTCECGGPYKHDTEINDRVVQAIKNDKRLRDTAVWVTTTRGFVTLQGCVRSAAEKSALRRLTKAQAGVVIVWNEVAIRRARH